MTRESLAGIVFAYAAISSVTGMAIVGITDDTKLNGTDRAAVTVAGSVLWPIALLIAIIRAAVVVARMVRPAAGIPAAKVVRR